MFETVVPEVIGSRSRRLFYETLPVSIALHALVIGACVAGALWNVVFPTQSPKLLRPYSLVSVPDPPPPPPPPPKADPAPAPKVKLPPAPMLRMVHLDVAPTIIPDLVPKIEIPPPAPPPEPVAVAPVAPPVPTMGDTKGAADGAAGGAANGVKHGTVGGIVFAEDGRVHIDRTEKLPLKEVEKGYPHYPDAARKKRLEDTCVVRYTIGKNGRVIDVAIIEHAKEAMFDEETVHTVRDWRFRPLIVNGKPVEVVHEVEVYYQFISR